MPLTTKETFIMMLIISVTTFLLRGLPFLLFPEHKKTPKYVMYLGKILPLTIVGMLVVYCLKDVTFLTYPYGLPEIISVGAIIGLHLWKGNTLLSIGVGTILYMIIIQVFIH